MNKNIIISDELFPDYTSSLPDEILAYPVQWYDNWSCVTAGIFFRDLLHMRFSHSPMGDSETSV